MRHYMIPVATLCLPLLTGCGRELPRVEITTPDRAQFQRCLGLNIAVPDLPPYEAFKLPDGRSVVLLARVRERDAIAARFLVLERDGRIICQASTRYADRWAEEMQQRKP